VILITLSYPNGRTREVALPEVPRVGDYIQPKDDVHLPSLIVEHVLWVEGDEDVVVSVRPRDNGPRP
jgi:hypothetical protein